ncbi:helix-turn-helix transcriptional regulator [Paraburkholderia xenovorans]|uniref:helix-turn-helix transcriptional regulator n=1 Tax=Paraburkholderia xenovorans TaxID=36873 RepID=UPI0038BB9822
MKLPQHTSRFTFHDATVLLIVSGQLDLDDGVNAMSADGPESLVLVEPNTRVDLLKTPGGSEQRFRSIFLTFSSVLLDSFHRTYPGTRSECTPAIPFRTLSLDHELSDTLRHVVESIENGSISDERLRCRLMDLLLAFAERGHSFGRVDLDSTAGRLRALIGEAPAHPWTAQSVGKELAMSPATLRRRLASEHVRFEDLLIDVRMHHAMMLIQTTAWGIGRIAEECGYKSRARFTERFQERFGYLPSAVR